MYLFGARHFIHLHSNILFFLNYEKVRNVKTGSTEIAVAAAAATTTTKGKM
jgi:hypothetical protein